MKSTNGLVISLLVAALGLPITSEATVKVVTTQETYELMFRNGIAPAGDLDKEVKSAYPLADKVNSQQGQALDRFIYTPEIYREIAIAVQALMAGDVTPEGAVDRIQAASDKAYK